jgi:hypothetical protein
LVTVEAVLEADDAQQLEKRRVKKMINKSKVKEESALETDQDAQQEVIVTISGGKVVSLPTKTCNFRSFLNALLFTKPTVIGPECMQSAMYDWGGTI